VDSFDPNGALMAQIPWGFEKTAQADRSGREVGQTPDYQVGMHEQGHTYQSQVLGPFFLPAYFLIGGFGRFNPFENAADINALTGQGWWPW
jgi:hypothetical protein